MGWLWKSLHHPPKLDLSFLSLLPLSCIVVTARNHSCPFSLASPLPAHSESQETVNKGKELEMEWPQLFRVLVQVGIDGSLQLCSKGWAAPRIWEECVDLAKKNPNVDCSSWHEEGHPIARCHSAGKHSWRVMVGNSSTKGNMKCLCPAANPPQQPVPD